MLLRMVQATQFFSGESPEVQHVLNTEFTLEPGQHSVDIDFPLPKGITVKEVTVLRRHDQVVWKPFAVEPVIKNNVARLSLSSGDYIVTVNS